MATTGSNLPRSGSHGMLQTYRFTFALLTFIFSYHLFAECARHPRSRHTRRRRPACRARRFSSRNALECPLFTFINIVDGYWEGLEPEGRLRAKKTFLHPTILHSRTPHATTSRTTYITAPLHSHSISISVYTIVTEIEPVWLELRFAGPNSHPHLRS